MLAKQTDPAPCGSCLEPEDRCDCNDVFDRFVDRERREEELEIGGEG